MLAFCVRQSASTKGEASASPLAMDMHHYEIVHSANGTDTDTTPVLAADLKTAWEIARQSFPGQLLMVIHRDDSTP